MRTRRRPRRRRCCPVASHSASAGVGEASPRGAPAPCAWASAMTLSAYDVVLRPGRRGPLVAHPRDRDTSRGGRRPRGVRHGGDDEGERRLVPVQPSGPRPPVTVNRSRREAERRRRVEPRPRRCRSRMRSSVGGRKAKPGERPVEAAQVPGDRERHAVVDLQRLEGTVAHRDAVVEDRSPRACRRRRACRRPRPGCQSWADSLACPGAPPVASATSSGRLELGLAPTPARRRSPR